MPAENKDAIVVVGARVHNLKNITVDIPLDSLTVVTGVSGSGKSSLAFDTLYAEGQRRYVASLSAYARQFLERIDRPDVDDIHGICPALAIRQKNYTRNPRSTVGTVTEINDHLRLLYARIGVTHCHVCGRRVEKDTPEKIADFVLALPQGTRVLLCMPLSLQDAPPGQGAAGNAGARGRARAPADPQGPETRLAMALPGLLQQGFVRLLIGDRVVDLPGAMDALQASAFKEVHVVVDRLVLQGDMRKRLVDSLELCGRESEGRIELVFPAASQPVALPDLIAAEHPEVRWLAHPAGTLVKFSEKFECQLCGVPYEEPEPRLFSFNNPFGACPECQGFGNTMTVDLDRVVPDKSKALAEGAVHPWTKPRYRAFQAKLLQFAQKHGIPFDVPWSELAEEDRRSIVRGKAGFPGVLGFFDYLEGKKYKMHVRIFISRYRGYSTCLACGGERLRREARDVLVAGKRITEVTRLSIQEAAGFFAGLKLTPAQESIAGKILQEIAHRLDLLLRVGLDYLSLDRLSSSLSGGESQRIQLATSLGSTLVGALYVLDEPSIGLHPRDSRRLVDILQGLKTIGNTVLVVEHDPEIMSFADHVIDLGPRAGEDGGRVVFQGSYASILQDAKSLTGRYLRGELKIPVPLFRRKPNGRCIEVLKARKHNLKSVDVRIPLGVLVCITGVSGSGKSTFVHEVLYTAIKRAKGEIKDPLDACDAIRGSEYISDAILVDQSPIGRTPRSNPATYVKAFDEIRAVFAETRDAYARNFGPGLLLLQPRRRTVRDLSGERYHHGGDAVPGRRRTGVRRLQRDALQERRPRGALQGKEHRRGARTDRPRGHRLLRRQYGHHAQAPSPGGNRARLSAARAIGDVAVGGRGAADQARFLHLQENGEEDAVHLRRTDHRPALRRHPQAASRRSTSCSRRATRSWSSSTTSTSSRRRTGSSTWARRGATPEAGWCSRDRPTSWCGANRPTRAGSSRSTSRAATAGGDSVECGGSTPPAQSSQTQTAVPRHRTPYFGVRRLDAALRSAPACRSSQTQTAVPRHRTPYFGVRRLDAALGSAPRRRPCAPACRSSQTQTAVPRHRTPYFGVRRLDAALGSAPRRRPCAPACRSSQTQTAVPRHRTPYFGVRRLDAAVGGAAPTLRTCLPVQPNPDSGAQAPHSILWSAAARRRFGVGA